jgi:hypothetical protein
MNQTIKYQMSIPMHNRISQLVEDQSQADRQFFDKNPSRAHLIRLSHPAEIALGETAFNEAERVPEGYTWYTAIRCVDLGVRFRLNFFAPPGLPASRLTEEQAEEIYETIARLQNAPSVPMRSREVAK